MKDKMANRRK